MEIYPLSVFSPLSPKHIVYKNVRFVFGSVPEHVLAIASPIPQISFLVVSRCSFTFIHPCGSISTPVLSGLRRSEFERRSAASSISSEWNSRILCLFDCEQKQPSFILQLNPDDLVIGEHCQELPKDITDNLADFRVFIFQNPRTSSKDSNLSAHSSKEVAVLAGYTPAIKDE
jgi:hypothetical protein